MNGRINPFDDLGDFEAKPVAKPVERAQIDEIAAAQGFPSRQPNRAPEPAPVAQSAPYRYTTGRDRQLNTKASQETKDRLARVAQRLGRPQAQVLEEALRAYEKNLDS